MDGGHAENAGAFFGGAYTARHAGIEGAFSGGCLDRTTPSKRSHFGWTDMPKMQEHFSAVPTRHDMLKSRRHNRMTSSNRNAFR